MKVKYNKSELTQDQLNQLLYVQNLDAVLNQTEIETSSKNLTIDQIIALKGFCEVIDFEVWMEIPTSQMGNDIPSELSWSTYQDEEDNPIQRKYSDMDSNIKSRSEVPSEMNICYMKGSTENISQSDLIYLKNVWPGRKFDKQRLIECLNDPDDYYYIEL